MKKNITINLCGRLFQIDEDAYEMLQHYMDSLRSCFGRQEGGDEIADDIEARIAELFDELKAQGNEAITIDHVKDIITRIGKPEQLADEEEGNGENTSRQPGQSIFDNMRASTAGKRLYRNPNDKMVAGVLSGFAAYTNIDVTFWRVGAVLLTLFYGTGILLYLLMVIVLPEAKTPEELLRMEGREVNPQNLANAVIDDHKPMANSGIRTVISLLLKVFFGIFVFIAVISGFALAIALIGLIVVTGFALAEPNAMAHWELSGIWLHHPVASAVFMVALLSVLIIPLYTIIHMVMSLFKKTKPMGMGQRITWIVLWLVALFVAIPLGINLGHLRDQYRHMENGVWMYNFDRNYMKQYGWKLVKHENCNDHFVKSGEHFTGEQSIAYLDAWDHNCMLVYQAEAQVLPADSGTFRITCNARAAGDGVFIYATIPSSPDKPLAQVMIPAYGSTGGKLWEQAQDYLLHLDQLNDTTEAPRYRKISEANDGQGYGWSPVELIVRLEKPDTLCYGVTTDPLFTGHSMDAQWFSACDFKVEKVEQ
jgi:phage shock protein PspC (stress-responsive transcriptional regulator)